MNGDGQNEKVVIIGIGDERKRDDAAGLMIARELKERTLPDSVRVEVAGEEGIDLVASMDGASRAIILAALALGDEPGTVHALSPGDAEARADYVSGPGEVALIDALELSRMRGGPDVLIVGIEPAEIVPGQTLHPEVQASVGEAAEIARDLATGNREWRFFARGDFED
jgi:hydrogenase maturation protease